MGKNEQNMIQRTQRNVQPIIRMRDRVFLVNCWHSTKMYDSAMWNIYSKKDEGIAVQSSFKNSTPRRDCFKGFDRDICIGKVNIQIIPGIDTCETTPHIFLKGKTLNMKLNYVQ